MDKPNKDSKTDKEESRKKRVWRLAKDVVITPVEELPEKALKEILPDGKIPEGRFGVQRKKVRAFPKIVNKDVVDVLKAFGEKGSTYNDVLEHFVKLRNLDREKLDTDLLKLVRTLVYSNFLVDGGPEETASAESVKPSFGEGDLWLSYTVKKNIYCMVDSEIYEVEHIRTGELKALKIMQKAFPNKEMKENIARRLNHEFEVIQSIDHPNVVKLWECGTHQGRTYGILDWVDGPPVRTYAHNSEIPPDDKKLMTLAMQCVEALRAVHAVGYLHGDVHTGNFLVKKGRVCLIDFGLSRPIQVKKGEESKYTEGGVIAYQPPEYMQRVFDKKKGFWNSVAGEIYSCGVILFALFTNRYPYKWKFYREDYMKSILNDPPLSFEESGRTSWPKLEAILHGAMSKSPEDRFASMTEFLQALQSIMIPASTGSNPFQKNMSGSQTEKKDHKP